MGDLPTTSAARQAQGTRVEIARRGLHSLEPYWSPDVDGYIDPLDDPETRLEVRRTLRLLFRDGFIPSRTDPNPQVNDGGDHE